MIEMAKSVNNNFNVKHMTNFTFTLINQRFIGLIGMSRRKSLSYVNSIYISKNAIFEILLISMGYETALFLL